MADSLDDLEWTLSIVANINQALQKASHVPMGILDLDDDPHGHARPLSWQGCQRLEWCKQMRFQVYVDDLGQGLSN